MNDTSTNYVCTWYRVNDSDFYCYVSFYLVTFFGFIDDMRHYIIKYFKSAQVSKKKNPFSLYGRALEKYERKGPTRNCYSPFTRSGQGFFEN